ncbi:hypothetical protein PtrM4_077820 [Pyrenophora tritici-repentis]|uniref:Integrase catalytic domain-containing protein n=1 Tax=Pyrenophora tritici-repentis TaxID=45151 RepID=A0A834RZY9_9PLEO|nr:hypothetical protein PtrM4_077820 [Pyrenophora tritici-repentis]
MSARIRALPAATQGNDQEDAPRQHDIENLWIQSVEKDPVYQEVREAVESQQRRFPAALQIKCSIAECKIKDQILYFRNRKWVPNYEPLRTSIIERIHGSVATGHPGREITYKMVARDFFWPGMSNDIRRYVRNCDTCGRTKPWRDGLQGLLKPLPVPEQIWKEISIDFIDGLPESDGKKSLMAVTDRLSKDVVFIPLANTETETVVQAFITYVVAYHWIPDAITSDRGTQFVSVFWRRLCEILRIVFRDYVGRWQMPF